MKTTAQVCKQNASLIPIGVADPRMNGVEQVDFCKAQGFPLMALFPIAQGWSLASVTAKSVLARLAEVNMPVLIEAGRDGDASMILAVAAELPLPIILLDVSLRTLSEAIVMMRARPQTYLATRLLCGADTIEHLTQTVGSERLIFTSRFPISCFSSAFLTSKYACVTPDDQAAVLGNNMAKLLKL